jgi:CBS domain-containing protein
MAIDYIRSGKGALVYRPVRSILEKKDHSVFTTGPAETVVDAVDKMNQHNIGSLVVVDGGRPIGIFTERDVLTRVVAQKRDPAKTRVCEVMTDELIAIRRTTTVEEAMRLVHRNRCRHLPVIEDGELIGMVSAGDLTRYIVEDQEHRISDLVGYITAG